MSTRSKVLYVAHSHPVIIPGGAEIYAYDLYQAIRRSDDFDAVFVARVGPPYLQLRLHEGTRFALVQDDPNEYFFFTRPQEFDHLLWTARRKEVYTKDWRAFLLALKPDIVHFQHTVFLGYDMIRETRLTLPRVPIVYTLHEFVPICHNTGRMVRTGSHQLCNEASPRRCHQCFPDLTEQAFFLRERFIRSAFELVDLFITPSEDARNRYVDWGIPAEKIRTETYGRPPAVALPDPQDAGRRRRIGFFGQLNAYKGIDVLLEAMKILDRDGADVQLVVRGANLEFAPPKFQEEVRQLLEETAGSVDFAGSYTQEELPKLLSAVDWVIVPSVWWETGPLVIHEARAHHRPVICSNIGAMTERVQDGINGLHFRVRDPWSLAETIRRAVDNPTLWDEMRGHITDPHSMDEHLTVITGMYRGLLGRPVSSSRVA